MEQNVTDVDRVKLWQKRLQELDASDMTKKDWCRENNIPESTLRYWIRKLRPVRVTEEKASDPDGWIQMPRQADDGESKGELSIRAKGVQVILQSDADPGLRARLIKAMVEI